MNTQHLLMNEEIIKVTYSDEELLVKYILKCETRIREMFNKAYPINVRIDIQQKINNFDENVNFDISNFDYWSFDTWSRNGIRKTINKIYEQFSPIYPVQFISILCEEVEVFLVSFRNSLLNSIGYSWMN